MTQKKNPTSFRHALALIAPFVMGAALMPVGCSAGADGEGQDVDNTDVFGMSYEEFKATVYQEPDTGLWIVDGDTPVADERGLRDFYYKHIQQGALSIYTSGGVDVKWSAAQQVNITYCISDTFGANKSAMVTAMNNATAAWEAAANVNFVHLTQYDSSCTASQSNVVFDVRPVSGQSYLARAFFPNSSRSQRNILVDSSSFGNLGQWTLAGILRHELGHTLGFRHEHTRPEAGTCFEDNNYRPLTEYDSKSVMHYPQCNGTNSGDLVLTAKDITGVQAIYGAPGGQPPPPPPPAQCAHDKCISGSALTSGCDACVTQICAADPYCCSTSWDSQCVQEVNSICGLSCGAQPAPCAHSVCTTGVKLAANCSSCATTVCAKDPYCCNTKWDGTCVNEAKSWCGAGACN
ncbi:MAG: M57 family metalloprotease [Polyangiaceae bacterium]|nr:M57 family metalloprotease [Polyangiaceae bacterium]